MHVPLNRENILLSGYLLSFPTGNIPIKFRVRIKKIVVRKNCSHIDTNCYLRVRETEPRVLPGSNYYRASYFQLAGLIGRARSFCNRVRSNYFE